MSAGLTQPIWMEMALALLILPGVLCTNWLVEYQDVCAVRGSSVVIVCKYRYPEMSDNKSLKVENVMWSQGRNHFFLGPFIIDSNNITHNDTKFEYVGDKVHNCSLKIHQVEQRDSGEYGFRFETNSNKWTGKNGAKVNVSELIISMTTPTVHGLITEGDCVNLTCMNNCSSAVTWFKNGKPLQEESSTLYLRDISFQDSGNYSCSPKHHNRPLSEVIRVNVEYGPRNTSVSVRPSSEVLEGSNVTLTCSSNANPTLNYTWFKIDGDSCLEMVSQAELQFVAHTVNSGKYFCVVRNKHGRENSTFLSLKVKEHAKVTLTILIAVLLVPMIVIVPLVAWHLVAHKKKTTASKPDTEENIQTTEVHVTSPTSHCSLTEERREEEPSLLEEVTYATVHINTKQRANIQQQNKNETAIYGSIWEQQVKEDLYSVVSRPTSRGKQAQDEPVI